MLTRQQLYEVYDEGPEATLDLIENLLGHLAEVERHVGHRQQSSIDALSAKVKQLVARVERLKAKLWQQESLNFRLTRRIQELQGRGSDSRPFRFVPPPLLARRFTVGALSGVPPEDEVGVPRLARSGTPRSDGPRPRS